MICKLYELNKLKTYKYIVVLSEYNGKILLSRHRNRITWETQKGHIEQGESPLEAARRELYEESGATEYEINPLCDYWAGNPVTKDGANGMVFTAKITKLSPIPESEMAEVRSFDYLPQNLTYPEITPILFAKKSIGKEVTVIVDRKAGTYHPQHNDIYYDINYGYIRNIIAGDGEEQDAYILGIKEPLNSFTGTVKAVVHRFNDIEDKWIVCPPDYEITENEIIKQVEFQEKYFKTCIVL